jgi:hypothetical protein
LIKRVKGKAGKGKTRQKRASRYYMDILPVSKCSFFSIFYFYFYCKPSTSLQYVRKMNSKLFNAFEGNEVKAEELRPYLRWSTRLFAFTVATAIVNLILIYGLTFHPSNPSPAIYA